MITIASIIEKAPGHCGRVAIAAAHDREVLRAACAAQEAGIAGAILVGNGGDIEKLLREAGRNPGDFEIIDVADDAQCAAKAVECAAQGRATLLMKGLLSTAALMHAVVDKEHGLRTGRLLSHVMLYEPPAHKLLALTDGGMNTFPDLAKKAGILENAARTLRALGYSSINAACVCGAETFDPRIQSMVDARALSEMKDRWKPYNMNVYGPVGLDLAVSPEACAHKHYSAPGAGEADILLVPTYEVGNGIGKTLSLFGKAKNAGIIVGAKVPVVLVSRADSAESKLASIAFGVLAAGSSAEKGE
jgi:phosphate butyryltransferase